ncbi:MULTISPECIES: hypothetical protein [unclassified Streptomyces]|uniref:hypothetical protein n=1 Tax=unclassified Streptomyces TaxID=2593676 RepID=UPI00099882F7|nr:MULTISPECIES: hypothetical protein [unclassified Streptomyces]
MRSHSAGYSALFRTREFTPLFLSTALQTAASTIGGLALGTLVYRATASPLLSAVSMFGPQLAQVVGASTLLSGADRLPPRTALTGVSLCFALATASMAAPGLPLGALFALLLVQGLVQSLAGGVRWGLLNEILSAGVAESSAEESAAETAKDSAADVVKGGYLLGRSTFNMMSGLTQITGFATGGVLVTVLSPRTTLLTSAALYAASALLTRTGLSRREPRATGRPSLARTWRTNVTLLADRPRRLVYMGLWVPNGLIVGCESLYVSYAPDRAGLLFACGACGMFAGDVVTGRFLPPAARARLVTPLLLLLAAPYLLFALHPAVPVAAACAALASVGFGASLLQQERLMSLTPGALTGHALGLHSAGMLTMQGVSASAAGTLAQLTSPATAMTAMAAASLAVTASLALAAPGSARPPAALRAGTAAAPAAGTAAAAGRRPGRRRRGPGAGRPAP